MKNKSIVLLLLLMNFVCEAADYQDYQTLGYHLEVCNSCNASSDFKNAALKSNLGTGTTVVVNIKTGKFESYDVWRDFEPGYGDNGGWVSDAYITQTPHGAINAI